MFFMFICMYNITYVKIQYNNSKLCYFISLRKMVKNTTKLSMTPFSIKLVKIPMKTSNKMFCKFAA